MVLHVSTSANDFVKLYVLQIRKGNNVNYLGRVCRNMPVMPNSRTLRYDFIALPDIVSVERRFLRGDSDAAREAMQTHCALYNLPRDRTHICSLKYWQQNAAMEQCEQIIKTKLRYWPFDVEEIDAQHDASRLPFAKADLSVVPIQLVWGQPHTAERLS
jgi:hypothetical protein